MKAESGPKSFFLQDHCSNAVYRKQNKNAFSVIQCQLPSTQGHLYKSNPVWELQNSIWVLTSPSTCQVSYLGFWFGPSERQAAACEVGIWISTSPKFGVVQFCFFPVRAIIQMHEQNKVPMPLTAQNTS